MRVLGRRPAGGAGSTHHRSCLRSKLNDRESEFWNKTCVRPSLRSRWIEEVYPSCASSAGGLRAARARPTTVHVCEAN